jgi:hypothetical protein
MDAIAPFLLTMVDSPDMNLSDLDTEIHADWQRQRIVERWLKGELPTEAMLDMASDQGIDGYDYEDMICHNVDAIVAQNALIDDAEDYSEGLWLPSSG